MSKVIHPKHRFAVFELDAANTYQKLGSFTRIGGLELEINTNDFRVGDSYNTYKVPGFTNYPVITLEKGVDSNKAISEWFAQVNGTAGSPCGSVTGYEKEIFIFAYGRDCTISRIIHVYGSWPSKYTVEDLDASSEDPWIESVEIQHSGWEYEDESELTGDTTNFDSFEDLIT